MKQKLEFPLFYIVWIATVGEVAFSMSKDHMLLIVVTGLVALGCTIALARINSGTDEVIGMLLKPLMGGMVGAIAMSAVVSRSPLMLCVLGPALLILWQIERGYAYGRTYES